jgi:hypothetical protein
MLGSFSEPDEGLVQAGSVRESPGSASAGRTRAGECEWTAF